MWRPGGGLHPAGFKSLFDLKNARHYKGGAFQNNTGFSTLL
jgi:hypothetical protein